MGLTPNTSYKWSLTAQLHQWRSPATVTATTPKQATTTTISNISPQSGSAGSSFTATAKVIGNSGFGTPAGTVTFRLYPTVNCTGVASFTSPAQGLNAGSATASLQPTGGTYHWQAIYNPTDSYNNPSTSSCSGPITVTQAGGNYFATGPVKTIAKSTENVDVQYPQGTAKGDLVLLVLLNTERAQSDVDSSEWGDIDHVKGDSHIGLQSWWRAAGTETSARINDLQIVKNQQPGRGASAWVITYKNMATPKLVNKESGTVTNATGNVSPSHLQTKSPNTTVISLIGTNKNSQLSMSNTRNFSLGNSLTVDNPPHALGVADKFLAKTATTIPPTWSNGIKQSTQWVFTTAAFTSSP
ncbi:Ig-like domain-containing protein [Paeniglutamicibacter antarcticus]|uniref:Ig-like domain-containing protein n=1 Tax=Paeniglutamicibacter antarcticus TaxID=494023 RepID=UPI0031E5B250